MSLNTGLDISNNANVEINNLNFDLDGKWLENERSMDEVIDIKSGKVIADNIKIDFTRELEKDSQITGINIDSNSELELSNSQINLGHENAKLDGVSGTAKYSKYGDKEPFTAKIENNKFTLNSEGRKIAISVALERALNANLIVSGNTLDSSNDKERYNIFVGTYDGIDEVELHAFVDELLETNQNALINNKNVFYEYPIVGADLTAYNKALERVSEKDYREKSWAAYQVIVEDNIVTVENTQEEVDAATKAIVEAQKDMRLRP